MIFYAIYKKQGNHFTIGVTLLQGDPRKESWFCNVVPRGGRPARLGQFRRGSLPAWPGKGWGRVLGSLGAYLGTRTGVERLRRAARRRPGRGGRCGCPAPARGGSGSGEASRLACVDAGEGGREVALARGRPEAGARRGWPWWRRWAARLAAGDGWHAWVRDSGA
jgi:hypothetical protein